VAVAALAVGFAMAAPAGAHTHHHQPPGPKVQDVPGLGGLAGPFGLDTGPGGRIYVSTQGAPPDESTGFPGAPGSIIEWKFGTATTLATFPGQGPSDIVFKGFHKGGKADLLYVVGKEDDSPTEINELGRLSNGQLQTLVDLGQYEADANPDQHQSYGPISSIPDDCLAQVPEALRPMLAAYDGIVDSNAYSVEYDPWTRAVLATDAGGNSVLLVGRDGVKHSWVLPPVPQTVTQEGIDAINAESPPDQQLPGCLAGLQWNGEPVPTSVVMGPDRMLYVSSLPGFPEAPGSGAIYRINPWTGEITKWVDGLTSAVDVTFDRWGNAYVAELFGGNGGGAVKRISTRWTWGGLQPTSVKTLASDADGLVLPSRVAVADNGAIYATANLFGEGKVVRIRG